MSAWQQVLRPFTNPSSFWIVSFCLWFSSLWFLLDSISSIQLLNTVVRLVSYRESEHYNNSNMSEVRVPVTKANFHTLELGPRDIKHAIPLIKIWCAQRASLSWHDNYDIVICAIFPNNPQVWQRLAHEFNANAWSKGQPFFFMKRFLVVFKSKFFYCL